MNLELLDPFSNSFPEVIEETLEEGFAITCAFNGRGTLLATGCNDGRCIIWDFDTRSIAVVLTGHVHPVTSISWSKDGKKLLSSSTDWTVKYYDVLTGAVDKSIVFESAILFAQMHPKNNDYCLACPHLEDPVLINLVTGEKKTLPSDEPTDMDGTESAKKVSKNTTTATMASFNKHGTRIFTGNAKGIITVIDTESLKILYSFKVPGGAPIKSITFSRSGKQFLLNSTDRIIRVFEGEESRNVAREFQDPVNKMQWKKCCFSGDADYIIGGSAQKSNHHIYIWNREEGQLLKNLEGPKEGIMDLVWHPARPIILSISIFGVVYIWASNYTENWSAFAPDFKELEENEEYMEREDEFDTIEEEVVKKTRHEYDQEVDVMTNEKISYFSSDDEDDLFFIPIKITPDHTGSTSANA